MELERRIGALIASGAPRVLVALDGKCATGKTTLARALAEKYGCAVCHMDDFFLRPSQRTPERLEKPGENIDHERFLEEVLRPLREGRPVSYRPWSCRTQSFAEIRPLMPARLTIVEGAYCLHPALRGFYDLRVVLTAPLSVRLSRLRAREGGNFPNYPAKWIPLEDAYFSACAVERCADLVLRLPDLPQEAP